MSPFDDKTYLRFEVGNMTAEWVGKALGDRVLAAEVPLVDRELRAAGNVDFYVRESGRVIGVELKSMNSKSFWYARKNRGGVVAQEHHFWQAAFYRVLSRQRVVYVPGATLPVPDEWVVLCVSKDDLTMAEDVVPAKFDELVLARLKGLNAAFDNDWLLPCTCEGWTKDYCSYLDKEAEVCCSESLFEKVGAK